MIISVRTLLIIVAITVFANSCTSKSNNTPVKAQKVEWSIDNGAIQSAETVSFIRIGGYNYIYATKNTTDISLGTNSTSLGNYALASATLGLTIAGKQWSALGGDITISSNSNSLLKGSFNGTFGLVNVDTVNISGTFEDVAYY